MALLLSSNIMYWLYLQYMQWFGKIKC